MPESTGSGTGSGEGEDLFEDLDKFFAPIQDVDWPETAESSPPRGRRAETPPSDAGDVSVERGSRSDDEDDDEDDEEDQDEAVVAGPTPGQEDLFASEGTAPISVWSAGASGEGEDVQAEPGEEPEGGVGFLFGEEPDEISDDEAITEEAFAQTPSAYVDLPRGGETEEEASVAELLEGADEPAPDLEAVEAAAEHFAESVRDEVSAEIEPIDVPRTEEVEIAALLGDEGGEAAEEPTEPEPSRPLRVGPEGLGGPSWQEPTAVEVGAEPERRAGAGRDVPLAFVTGLVLAGLALGAIAIGPGPFALLASIVVLVAQGEFYFALQKRHYQPATALGLAAGALVLAAGYYRGESAMVAMVALGTMASLVWYMTVPVQQRRNVVTNVALTVLGIVYIPMLAAYALALLDDANGRGLVVAILGLTIAYDIAAFGVGYFWGSRPLAPNVSPKKSWEGAIGATLVVVALAVGAVAPYVELLDTVGRSVGLALVVAVFAPLGDLAESVLKRDLGLKDMGSILPGHGGVLDRIDAVLFVAPAAYIYLRLILG